jgi:hypothetical protein
MISYGLPDKSDKPGHEHLSGETNTRTDKDTPLIGCPVVRMSGPSVVQECEGTAAMLNGRGPQKGKVTL